MRGRASGLLGGGALEQLAQPETHASRHAVQQMTARQEGEERLAATVVLLQLVQDTGVSGLEVQALLESLERRRLHALPEIGAATDAIQNRVEGPPRR